MLSVCCFVRFLTSQLRCVTRSLIFRMVEQGSLEDPWVELTIRKVFSTVISIRRSSQLVPLDTCLTAAACLSSAC